MKTVKEPIKGKATTNNKPLTKTEVEKDSQNGITRPKKDTKTGLLWSLADKLSVELKAPAGRKAVLEAAAGKELNPATAATQYGRWRKYNGLTGTGREEN